MTTKNLPDIDSGYHELALAIMERAIKDLSNANRQLGLTNSRYVRKEDPKRKVPEKEWHALKADVEDFLGSDWCYNLLAGTSGISTDCIRKMAAERTSICAVAEV